MLGRRHCDERHRRLSAWDSRRSKEGKLRPGDQSLGGTEPQQRLMDEHADEIRLVNYQMEAQPFLLSCEAQTEDQKTSARYGSGDRKLQLFVHGHRGSLSLSISELFLQTAMHQIAIACLPISFELLRIIAGFMSRWFRTFLITKKNKVAANALCGCHPPQHQYSLFGRQNPGATISFPGLESWTSSTSVSA